jgi:PEP-CTERM motif
MKKLMIMAAALLVACAAYGQGQFFFNTHDTTAGNVLTFVAADGTTKITGADFFVEVLAGKDVASLTALTPTLALNRTGAGAGFANPFSGTYTLAGMAGGSSAFVGYRAYEGTSFDSASRKSGVGMATSPVVLTEPPTPPNEVALGTHSVVLTQVPEPATLALGLLGLGTILAFRRRS